MIFVCPNLQSSGICQAMILPRNQVEVIVIDNLFESNADALWFCLIFPARVCNLLFTVHRVHRFTSPAVCKVMETTTTVALVPPDNELQKAGIQTELLRENRFRHIPPKLLLAWNNFLFFPKEKAIYKSWVFSGALFVFHQPFVGISLSDLGEDRYCEKARMPRIQKPKKLPKLQVI